MVVRNARRSWIICDSSQPDGLGVFDDCAQQATSPGQIMTRFRWRSAHSAHNILVQTEMQELLEACKQADVVYFSDAVHPQHNTRACYGWIKSGKTFEVESNTGRDRVNINAALNAHDVCDVVMREDESINAESTIALYEQLQEHHREGRIHVICDNAKYYRSRAVKEWVENSRIVQVFLPSYSPNLNLIERLWRFFRKKVTDTEFYPTKEKFREAVRRFFNDIEQHRSELESLLTLNFRVA